MQCHYGVTREKSNVNEDLNNASKIENAWMANMKSKIDKSFSFADFHFHPPSTFHIATPKFPVP